MTEREELQNILDLLRQQETLISMEESLQEESVELKAENRTLQKQLKESTDLNEDLLRQLKGRDRQIETLQRQIDSLKNCVNG